MEILIVGGTGNISWRLAHAALAAGWHVTLLNRCTSGGRRRVPPPQCKLIKADINDSSAVGYGLANRSFDAIVDFLCCDEYHARRAVSYFRARTRHYIFISTTALYDRAIAKYPLTEDAPIVTVGWNYALAKAAAERVFADALIRDDFPVSVIRPGHTYDTIIPEAVGDGNWTNPWRLLNGKPIVLHGDGATPWTVTHSSDFARAIVEFLKSGHPPGGTFHITSDEAHTWLEITAAVCREIGIAEPRICYRTIDEIESVSTKYGNGIRWHKMWPDIYDNRKFKSICPSWRVEISLDMGAKEAIAHYRHDMKLLRPDKQLDVILDAICAARLMA